MILIKRRFFKEKNVQKTEIEQGFPSESKVDMMWAVREDLIRLHKSIENKNKEIHNYL